MKAEINASIPEERRKRMLFLIDGIPELALLMEHLNRYERCDAMLRWCQENGQYGKKLLSTFKADCAGSPLHFAKEVLKRLGGDSELRPVMYGRDYR